MAVLLLLVLSQATALPLPKEAIALRVAGDGMPECRSYYPDGREGPCLPQFELGESQGVNATSQGFQIAFTRGAIARLSDDEFALLTGHELAHTYLGHRRSTLDNERAADRLGAELACKAGFDPAKGASLFRYLQPGASHPARAERVRTTLAVPCRAAPPEQRPSSYSLSPGPAPSTALNGGRWEGARFLPRAAGKAGLVNAEEPKAQGAWAFQVSHLAP